MIPEMNVSQIAYCSWSNLAQTKAGHEDGLHKETT